MGSSYHWVLKKIKGNYAILKTRWSRVYGIFEIMGCTLHDLRIFMQTGSSEIMGYSRLRDLHEYGMSMECSRLL